MTTAVKIQTLDITKTVLGSLLFEPREVLDVAVFSDGIKSIEKFSQSGSPTLFLTGAVAGSVYHKIEVQFYLQGKSTTDKMLTIRDHILNGGIVRVFPEWQEDTSTFFDCYVKPDNILARSIFSGFYKKGKKVKLLFQETDMSSQVSISDTIIVT